VPPLHRERVERIMAALATHRTPETTEGTVSATVDAELRAHLPRPNVARPTLGA